MKVIVHVDGGARGNPGPAAVAAVASTPDGDELAERKLYIGEELARDLGADEIEVINDSELIARQIGGEYRVKHAGLKPLFAQATSELRGFDRWAVRSVRREQNTRADELVNEALDEALA